jgi:Zn-dependent protease
VNWRGVVYFLIGVGIGVVFHEYMHARVADWRGDHTARNAGRLTLNPIPHIDPFGTVLLPLGLAILGRGTVPAFGYAKPVPVNPFFLRRKRDMMLVAIAGPLTNFTLALAVAVIGRLLNVIGIKSNEIYLLILYIAWANLWLGVFNFIPIPPLDGSHILEYYLPASAREGYERISQFGFVLVFLVLWAVGPFLSDVLHPVLVLLEKIMGV